MQPEYIEWAKIKQLIGSGAAKYHPIKQKDLVMVDKP